MSDWMRSRFAPSRLTPEYLRLATVTLGSLLVMSLAALLSVKLADSVSEDGGATVFDRHVLDWVIRNRSGGLDTFFKSVTHLGDPPAIIGGTTAVSLVLLLARRYRLAGFMVLSTVGAAVGSSVGKLAVNRSRPPSELWLGHAWGSAFPSGHATQSVACYGAIAIVVVVLVNSRWLQGLVLSVSGLIALSVGLSRIYLAVHWFWDVVCGWALGAAWLAALVLIGWSTPRLRSLWSQRNVLTNSGSLTNPDETHS